MQTETSKLINWIVDCRANSPFRWWINDDPLMIPPIDPPLKNSKSNLSPPRRAEVPREVDSLFDLVNYFPIALDIERLLRLFPPDRYNYNLSQPSGALSVVLTPLTEMTAYSYLESGSSGDDLVHKPKHSTQGSGYQIPATFFSTDPSIPHVLIADAQLASESALRLSIVRGNTEMASLTLPLKISAVKDMVRWLDIRHPFSAAGLSETRLGEPPNRPDSETNNRLFVFVHGYNINEAEAASWGAQVFKRMRQVGFRGAFLAVDWWGDRGRWPYRNRPELLGERSECITSSAAVSTGAQSRSGKRKNSARPQFG